MIHKTTRSEGIDLARTLAILGVVSVHSGCFSNGRFGVQLFFLVSGFLLADLGNLSTREFLIRRGFRLFPLYWLILFLFYSNGQDSIGQFIPQILLIQSTYWNFNSMPGAWSISNEWLFSLILPFINRLNKKYIFILIFISWFGQFLGSYVVYVMGRVDITNGINEYGLRIWLNTLNPGINLAFLLIGVSLKKKFLPILRNKFVAFYIVVFAQLITHFTGLGLLFIWPLAHWAIFSLCITWTSNSNVIKSSINFIGQRTYGIFFIHFIILGYVQNTTIFSQLSERFPFGNWIIFAITFACSLVLSEASWRLVERPSIIFSKRFINI